MKTIYLNRKRLMEAGAIVDIKEYHRKYSLEKRNGAYAMAPGTPFVINVDGTYILLSTVATLASSSIFALTTKANSYLFIVACTSFWSLALT